MNFPFLFLRVRPLAWVLTAVTMLAPLGLRAADLLVKDGQKITFLGDLVTARSAGKPSGYVQLVVSGLKANGITVTPTTSAGQNDTSADLLARIDKILAAKPDWITLSCGLNDLRRGAKGGVDATAFQQNIDAILAKAEAAGVKVMVLTCTPLREKLDSDANQKLLPYNDVLRTAAKDKKLPLADNYATFEEALGHVLKPGVNFTVEGLFMNPHGDELMAVTLLRTFGLTPAQIDVAKKAWDAIPLRYAVQLKSSGDVKGKELSLELDLSREDFDRLLDVTNQRPGPIEIGALLSPYYKEEVQALLAPAGPYATTQDIITAGKEAETRTLLETKMRERIQRIYNGDVIKKNR